MPGPKGGRWGQKTGYLNHNYIYIPLKQAIDTSTLNVGFKELHTRIWIILHNVGCSFKLLPQNFYAVLIHHSAEVMRYLKWILYAYQMTIVPNSPCPVFLLLAVHINSAKNIQLVTGTEPTTVLISMKMKSDMF
jgi:hypothetical protein